MQQPSFKLPYSISEDGNQIIDAEGTVIMNDRSQFPLYIKFMLEGWSCPRYNRIKAGGTLSGGDAYNVHAKLNQMPS